jgi:hypothetical protein
MKPDLPVSPIAIGSSAKIVAIAVIRIGRRRRVAPSINASRTRNPRRRYWLTRSMSTIAFVTTMPTSMSRPISDATPIGTPDAICSRIAPVAANGTDTSSSSGWSRLRNVATMIT